MNRAVRIDENHAWAQSTPTLSVLIPFLRDEPSRLLNDLDREADRLNGAVEIVILDDGTANPGLTQRLVKQLDDMRLPTRFISLETNEGRSSGRNRLADAARGTSLLFLDSDMAPDTDQFLANWLTLKSECDPPVAFGGFSLLQAPKEARFAVHRAMALRSDCLPASRRALQPEKHVFTSNLLVRRDVFESEAFDPAFTGWGWEDVEWAMRVSRRHPVLHVENPATHLGLDTVEALAAKYRQSAGNFARVVAQHPDIVRTYPSYKAAQLLKRTPGVGLIGAATHMAALTSWLPAQTRGFALRLYRATLYARAV